MTKDSRLEKFLKALCSLDYSDLPTPLSRVEVLWNCLIIGEATPDFQPQSRTEKYLMTILGVYDLEDIPKPISRGEVLLYKLAMGDTDVDLEDGAKSRYELLLSEIVANGGVGDNVDFEYVSYVLSESFNTLHNTAEKSVKSAILKGNTLVNVNRPITRNVNMKVENGLQILTTWTTAYNIWMVNDITLFKTNTKYYIIAEVIDNTLTSTWSPMIGSIDCVFSGSIPSLNFAPKETGIKCATFTTKSDFTNVISGLRSATGTNETVGSILKFRIAIIEYQDGMENWDIPYFEGMQSVKMPVLKTAGKNLFDINGDFIATGATYSIHDNSLTVTGDWFVRRCVDVKPNTTYTLSCEAKSESGYIKLGSYYNGTSLSITISKDNRITFTTPSEFNDVSVIFYAEEGGKINTVIYSNIQLEEGSMATQYESYKSNSLTVNEDVTLRSNGGVYDELDLLTGKLTQRINEDGGFLSQEVIKTVDLSTLDQDGKETELKTFNDITYVSLSSEGLIPEAEMTVATKNLDDISQVSTMSLRMNDISNRQSELQNEVDTQSESIDSTMMATTEIYEQTL